MSPTLTADTSDADLELQTAGSCPHCHAANYTRETWCRSCGFYALLGRCIEMEEWEREMDRDGPRPAPPRPATWCGLPVWAWQLGTALMAVGLITAAGFWLTPSGTPPRVSWATIQALLGGLSFVGAYLRIATVAMRRNKGIALSDLIMSPKGIWTEAFLELPHSFPRLAVAATGLWTWLLASVVLGVPYGSLFDFKSTPTPKKKSDLLQQVASQVGGGGGPEMTLEEALDEFSDKAGTKGVGASAGTKKGTVGQALPPEEPLDGPVEKKEVDCLVLGFLPPKGPGAADELSLVVAVSQDQKWRVIGLATGKLPPRDVRRFLAATESLHRDAPLVPCSYPAVWLQARIRCRVEAETDAAGKKFRNLRLLKLL